MPLCLEAAGHSRRLDLDALSLAWTHSIEHVRWEEDWRIVEDGRGGLAIVVVEARIKGSGAGMEPPDDARLEGGWWRYRPALPPRAEVVLARSGVVADYEVRPAGSDGWHPLGGLLPGLPADAPVTLRACP